MNSKNISRLGMMTALTIIILLMTSVFPTLKLTLLAVTTIVGGFIYLRMGIKSSVMVYATVSILSFFVLPSKAVFVAYASFFGNYAFIKAIIEKCENIKKEWVLKIICSVIYSFIFTLLAKIVGISVAFNKFVFVVVFIVLFAVFDIVLSFVFTNIQKFRRDL